MFLSSFESFLFFFCSGFFFPRLGVSFCTVLLFCILYRDHRGIKSAGLGFCVLFLHLVSFECFLE